jgi:hypothetical protein
MKSKHCNWCELSFETDISYQIYCSSECREASTKEKIFLRYTITKRKNRFGKTRTCKLCSRKLSAYNDDVLCDSCSINPAEVSKALKEIKRKKNE